MAQGVGQEVVDLGFRPPSHARESQVEIAANALDDRSPIRQQLIVGHERARLTPGVALCAQDMLEPQQTPPLFIDPL